MESIFNINALRESEPDLVCAPFSRLADWKFWVSENRWVLDKAYIESFVPLARAVGVVSLWLGHVLPEEITFRDDPPTAFIFTRGLSQIERMLLNLIASMPIAANPMRPRVYAAEAQSAWALQMRGRFPKFIGSGYYPEDPASLYPIENQDLASLTYPSGIFDLAITVEVLEHLPDLPGALTQLARILRPGGVMLSTVPFRYFSPETEVRARLVNGSIEHLMPPEYHGDPHRSEGALVYQTPGWDILDLCKDCGFRNAQFLFYSSRLGGIVAPHLAGRWTLVCER